jgi:hypothetical protein
MKVAPLDFKNYDRKKILSDKNIVDGDKIDD